MDKRSFSGDPSGRQSPLSEEEELRPEEESMSFADPPLKSLLKVGMEEEEEEEEEGGSPREPPQPQKHTLPFLHGVTMPIQGRLGSCANTEKAGPVAEGTMHLQQGCREGGCKHACMERACVGKAGPVAEGAMHLEKQGGVMSNSAPPSRSGVPC
eukprot:scaffold87901_cov13-Tisochrysis_lutea.AAC.1